MSQCLFVFIEILQQGVCVSAWGGRLLFTCQKPSQKCSFIPFTFLGVGAEKGERWSCLAQWHGSTLERRLKGIEQVKPRGERNGLTLEVPAAHRTAWAGRGCSTFVSAGNPRDSSQNWQCDSFSCQSPSFMNIKCSSHIVELLRLQGCRAK